MSEEPELVAIFADADAQRFVWALVERGIERGCLRSMRRVQLRETMRDAALCQDPLAVAKPFLSNEAARFLLVWDHQGSGREGEQPSASERRAVEAFTRTNIRAERVLAVALSPEFEIVLEPVWERVCEELAAKRKVPSRTLPFEPTDPKGSFRELTRFHRLRADAALFGELAGRLSLDRLKQGPALERIARRLLEWFPGPTVEE
jgi:hypothetical protein